MFPSSKTALKNMRVAEMKALLAAHGKATQGKKPELTKKSNVYVKKKTHLSQNVHVQKQSPKKNPSQSKQTC